MDDTVNYNEKQYLDKAGLKHVFELIDNKYISVDEIGVLTDSDVKRIYKESGCYYAPVYTPLMENEDPVNESTLEELTKVLVWYEDYPELKFVNKEEIVVKFDSVASSNGYSINIVDDTTKKHASSVLEFTFSSSDMKVVDIIIPAGAIEVGEPVDDDEIFNKEIVLNYYIKHVFGYNIPMDVVLVKNDNPSEKIVVKANDGLSAYKDDWTPIGIVVIPKEHDVYGTGEAGVMSLKYMRYDAPDEGGSVQQICCGQNGTDISELKNFNKVANCGRGGSEIQENLQLPGSVGCLPIDLLEGKESKTEGLQYINYPISSNSYYIPSPYLSDGSRNPDYYDKTISTEANALSDFNGKENTKILCDLATEQEDWKTSTSITNIYNAGYSPAACCCWRYHTLGTNQGDWYLPACGELGYAVTRINAINSTLDTIKSSWSSSDVSLNASDFHLSSSEYDYQSVRCVSFKNGNVSWWYKANSTCVRAFLRLAFTS